MNKNVKRILLAVLIIAFICISSYATVTYMLNATQVNYNTGGENTITVSEALNDLYGKAREAQSYKAVYDVITTGKVTYATEGEIEFYQGQEVTYKGEQFYVLYDVHESDELVELFAKYYISGNPLAQSLNPYRYAFAGYGGQYWSEDDIDLNLVSGFDNDDAMGLCKLYGAEKRSRILQIFDFR